MVGLRRDGQDPTGYLGVDPTVRPKDVKAQRAPLTSDRRFKIGTIWINQAADQSYQLTNVAAGSATWTLLGPGASDVDTLTGDSGGALSPAAGNINILGGTNMTVAGAGSTLTANMDAAIVLATSVTAPLITSAAGMQITPAAANDLNIDAATGQDLILKMGDNAAANKVSFTDSDDAEVASIDSNGAFTTTGLTFTGLLTANASATILTAGTALTLAADNSADAVILGGGTSARAITIGQDAAAHTVAIGQAAAGAITVDTAAGISLDAATASNFTVTGAADLSLISTAGSIVINAEEAAADAIQLTSAAGGLSASLALQMSLVSTQAAANAIVIDASNAAGGIDMDCGSGGFALDAASGAISLDAALASNLTVTGAADLSLISTAGSVIVNGEEAVADAIQLTSAAGGLAASVALQMNLASSQAAADAILINASNAAGGIDMDCGTAGCAIDSTGAISLDSAAASNFTVTGAFDLTLSSSAGSVDVVGAKAAEDAILLNASNAAGGIILQTGGGDITISATVKEINAEFLFSSGTDLTVTQSPMLQSNADTGAAPSGATGDVNLMYLQDGCLMEQFILGAGQTIIAPRMTANGCNLALDQIVSEGAEYNFGARNNAKHAYTIGTSAAFFIEATIYVEDISGCLPLMFGFRKVEANNATLANYTDYAAIGLNDTTSSTNVVILDELNGGGQTATDTTDAWGGDLTAQTVKVLVSAAGVVTFEVGGSAASAAPAYTFDNTDVVMPFIHFLHGADVAGEVSLQNLKIGFQA